MLHFGKQENDYIGLIIAMPLIAHASWHPYCDLVVQGEQAPS